MIFFQRILLIQLLLFSFFISSSAQNRNGNWWLNLSESKKFDYLVGFLDGMDLGFFFSYLELKDNSENQTLINEIINSYNKNKSNFFHDVTYKEIIKEIDDLYNIKSNRGIKPRLAIYITIMKINGFEKQQIDNNIRLLKGFKE